MDTPPLVAPPARAASPPPRFLDRVRGVLRTRHFSRRTEEAHVAWIRRFILFHGKRQPNGLGAPEVTGYLSHLASRRQVSASTQNQAFSAPSLPLLAHFEPADGTGAATSTPAE